ncbi:unnamed protein product [Calypogeia fissa]
MCSAQGKPERNDSKLGRDEVDCGSINDTVYYEAVMLVKKAAGRERVIMRLKSARSVSSCELSSTTIVETKGDSTGLPELDLEGEVPRKPKEKQQG